MRSLKALLNLRKNVKIALFRNGGLLRYSPGGSWVNFWSVCAAGLSKLLRHYGLFSGQLSIIDPILVTFRQVCNFRDPNLVTFYFYELNHFLDRMKTTLLFIYSTSILVRLVTVNKQNCLTPKKSENVRPHSSNSIENATTL